MELERCLKVLKILNNEVDTFTYEGKMKFIESPNRPNTYILDNDNMKYICKVNVNLKNIRRFVKNESAIKFIMNHPHELYELKARYLYFKLKAHYVDDWWD